MMRVISSRHGGRDEPPTLVELTDTNLKFQVEKISQCGRLSRRRAQPCSQGVNMFPLRHVLARKCLSFVVALLLLAAAPAFAEQRLVRVLWDVGRKVVYVQVNDRTQAGHDSFSVPATEDAAHTAGFNKYESYAVLKKGDSVRLYVVNYNPVAHVWHESSVAEIIAPEPSLGAAILQSLVAGSTGGLTLPSAWVQSLNVFMAGGRTGSDPCETLYPHLKELTEAAQNLESLVGKVTTEAASSELNAAATKAEKIPIEPLFWNTFDNDTAARLIPKLLGFDFETKYTKLKTRLDEADAAITTVNTKLLEFDRELIKLNAEQPTGSCADVAKHRDVVQAFMSGITNADSLYTAIDGKYASTKKLLKGYADRLSADWTADAVEVVVKDPVVEDGALRLDGVFVSPNTAFTARTQRSLVLKVETYFPVLTISSGVAANWFKFKTLAVTQLPSTAADGTVTAKGQIGIVDDPEWDKIVPVWIENFRLFGHGHAGLYFSFGTTPDRNIFQNGIAGLSLVIPKWRASFTGGIIAARGYEEEDLKPLVTKFSGSDDFAIEGVDITKLPMEKPGWKRAGYFSITFMLVSF
jgi:hypothetical protein